MKRNRLIIGLPSVLLASLFLFHDLEAYFFQQKYPDLLWNIPIHLKEYLSRWIVAILLLFAGAFLLFNKRISQNFYSLFGISIMMETYSQAIEYDRTVVSFGYFLILPLIIGFFSLMIVTSEKWKKRLFWEKTISLKIWFIYIIIALLISGLPRLILDYPVI